MSEVRLVIREAELDWSGTVHGSLADRAIAALSADPLTLSELEDACTRFERPNPNRRVLVGLSAGLCDEPHDAGLVVIDLVARLVVVDSTYSSLGLSGEVNYHDGRSASDTRLRYHLGADWLFASKQIQWSDLAASRRRERTARPPLDARDVFYGRPLIEFIARETFAAHAGRETSSAPDVIMDLHAAWLLTPRDDLEGACPRDVALERLDHVSWDLQDQADRWSLLDQCPPALDESSFAYCYGGFGTHELVEYYGLVRELLWSSWNRLDELGKPLSPGYGSRQFAIGDFLTSEVPRLERVREKWLDTPDPECHGRTPRSIIERERARLPELMSRHDAIVDPDCPLCQMMVDMPGPMFWHLDGCNMDDDFAFDIRHRTREEWEAERRKWEEFDRAFEAKQERHPQGGTEFGQDNSVWSSSFAAADSADVPLADRLFGIGSHLAELIADLRGEAGSTAPPDVQQHIDRLNRDFGNLRELLPPAETSLAGALLEPVIECFTDALAAVALARSDLFAKCESLTSDLAKLVNPRSAAPTLEGDDLI